VQLEHVFALLAQAKLLCGHSQYVVIGSVSVLGLAEVATIPSDMTMSIGVACYTLVDPPRIFDLAAQLGEGSAWQREHGVYLDPVSQHLATLPNGWAGRLVRLERAGVELLFLDPVDAAVSKLARGEPRDVRWVRAGCAAGLVSVALLELRARATDFFDAVEQAATLQRIDALPTMPP
jgi:hypothetical protein